MPEAEERGRRTKTTGQNNAPNKINPQGETITHETEQTSNVTELVNIKKDLQEVKNKLESFNHQAVNIDYLKIQNDFKVICDSNLEQIKSSINKIKEQFDSTQKRIEELESSDNRLSKQIANVNNTVNNIAIGLENLASNSSLQEVWKNPSGLNDIFNSVKDINSLTEEIKASSPTQKQLNGALSNISDLSKKIVDVGENLNNSKNVLEYSSASLNTLKIGIETKLDKINKLDTITYELNSLKNELEELKPKKKQKTYLTWTSVFAFVLIFSAIFITRRFIVDFSNQELLISALVFSYLTVIAICAFNIVFFVSKININNKWRLLYYIVCGILVAVTFALAISVLAR